MDSVVKFNIGLIEIRSQLDVSHIAATVLHYVMLAIEILFKWFEIIPYECR